MPRNKRVAILTGGGDVPGLNVAIKAVVERAHSNNIDIIGIRRGWKGLLSINPDDRATIEKWTMSLTTDNVRTIDRTGGTILHTSRTNPGNVSPDDIPDCVAQDDRVMKENGKVDCTSHVLKAISFLSLDAIIPIGGDDTLSYACGFSTAVTRSVDSINALRTTAGSHERILVVELFGRNSGETSLFAAYLADVDRAAISEVPFDTEKLINFLVKDRSENPSNYAVLTISEGAHPIGGAVFERGIEDAYGHKKLGGIGSAIAEEIRIRTGINTIYQQLAYIMRSGTPDSLDRMVAVSYGSLALDQIAMGHSGRMVALQQASYTTVPLEMVIAARKQVDVTALYDVEMYRPKVRDTLGKPMFLY
jgi:6-phosphofructokinase